MAVRDLLRKKPPQVITIGSNATVGSAARLLLEHRIGGLPVLTDHGRLLGFISERDVVRAVDQSPGGVHPLPVHAIMRNPPPICAAGDSLQQAMTRMTRDRLRHLVVLEGEELLGVISVGDLVKDRLEQLETEAAVLRDYVAAQRAVR